MDEESGFHSFICKRFIPSPEVYHLHGDQDATGKKKHVCFPAGQLTLHP